MPELLYVDRHAIGASHHMLCRGLKHWWIRRKCRCPQKSTGST